MLSALKSAKDLPRARSRDAEERFKDSGYYDQEDAGTEPGGRQLVRILFTVSPGVVHFDGADEAYDGSNGIQKRDAGIKVPGDQAGSLRYPRLSIRLGQDDGRKTGEKRSEKGLTEVANEATVLVVVWFGKHDERELMR